MLIRRTEISDANDICKLRHDQEILNNIHTPLLFPTHEVEAWIKNLAKDSQRFTVLDEVFNCLIGLVRIDHIDLHNNTCYVGLDIARDYRGQGLSKEIYEWIFNYLFNNIGMRILYLEVLDSNERATKLYEKLGFKECGRFPSKVYNNGGYRDSIIMYFSREMWQCQKESSLQVEQASADHT